MHSEQAAGKMKTYSPLFFTKYTKHLCFWVTVDKETVLYLCRHTYDLNNLKKNRIMFI